MKKDSYIESILKYPLLDRKREIEVAREVKKGNSEMRDLLIMSNTRLVLNIVKRYFGRGEFEDLVQQGNLGLIRAVDKFDPEKGFRFSTYATTWIRNFIEKYLIKEEEKIPKKERKILRAFNKVSMEYFKQNGSYPSLEVVVEKINKEKQTYYSYEQVKEVVNSYGGIVTFSLNQKLNTETNSEKLETVASGNGRDDVSGLSKMLLAEEILSTIKKSDFVKNDKKILIGFLYEDKRGVELSKETGLTRQTVKRRYERGIRKLRKKLLE